MDGQWREPNERKSWEDYARRTAEYAFSYSGERAIKKQDKQNTQWNSYTVENRQAVWQRIRF